MKFQIEKRGGVATVVTQPIYGEISQIVPLIEISPGQLRRNKRDYLCTHAKLSNTIFIFKQNRILNRNVVIHLI